MVLTQDHHMPNACVGAICSVSRSRGGLEQTRCPDGAGCLKVAADSALRYQSLSALVVPRPRLAPFRRVSTATLLLLGSRTAAHAPRQQVTPPPRWRPTNPTFAPNMPVKFPSGTSRAELPGHSPAMCGCLFAALAEPCVWLSPVPGCRAARAHAESDTRALCHR